MYIQVDTTRLNFAVGFACVFCRFGGNVGGVAGSMVTQAKSAVVLMTIIGEHLACPTAVGPASTPTVAAGCLVSAY